MVSSPLCNAVVVWIVVQGLGGLVRADDSPEVLGNYATTGLLFRALSVAEVQHELQLTGEQLSKIKIIKDESVSAFAEWKTIRDDNTLTDEARNAKLIEWSNAHEEKFRRQLLSHFDDAQRHRFEQIIWQCDIPATLIFDEKVRKVISLSTNQSHAIRDARRKHMKESSQIRGPRATFYEQQADAAARLDQKVMEILSEEQRHAWSQLVGDSIDVRSIRIRPLSAASF